MGRCIIPTCRNHFHKTRTSDKNVKYHSFPRDPNMRLEWIKKLKTDTWVPETNAYVCSEHFLPTDFERDLKAELLKLPPKRILKPMAIPTVNLSPSVEVACEQKKKAESLESENKENLTDLSNVKLNNGYIISYLGKPRLFITNTYSKTVDGINSSVSNYNNPSKIVSLAEQQNVEDSPFALNENPSLVGNNENLVANKNIFNLDDLCRLCGSYSNRMVPIFGSTKSNFPAIIENHFPEIEILKDDILPTQVCFKCENSVTAWYQFYKTCNTVNKRFQSILRKLVNEPDIKQKLATRENTDSTTKNSKNFSQDKMDKALSYVYHDENEGEIEIVEVRPELFCSIEEIPNITKEEMDKMNHERKSAEEDESTFEIKTESEGGGIEDEEDGELSMGTTEDDDLLPDSGEIPPGDDVSGKPISKPQERLLRRRLRRRQLSMGALRMCHMCGKVFKYPESLRRHLKTVHSDERPFKCHLCESSFNRNHNLTIHIKVVHQRQRVYPKKKIPRLCDYCGKVLLSSRSLEEHISCMHTKRALYECDKCHATFYRKLSFEKHRATNQCDQKISKSSCVPKTEEVFLKYCEICGLEFKKEHFYLKHKLKHMSSFTCPVCSAVLDDCTMLKDHLNMEHPEVTPFECATCGKKFKTKALLNCHTIIHSGEKRYKCEYCSIRFLKKKYLTTHILTHTGERPFVCTICNKGFKQSGDMRKHKATHIRKQL